MTDIKSSVDMEKKMKTNYLYIYRWMGLGKFTALVLALLLVFIPTFFITPQKAYAATSPTLGDAESFSILAKTLISDADVAGDLTSISGDVGLDNAGSNYSGLTTVEVAGTIYDTNGTGPDGVAPEFLKSSFFVPS